MAHCGKNCSGFIIVRPVINDKSATSYFQRYALFTMYTKRTVNSREARKSPPIKNLTPAENLNLLRE